MNRKKHKPTQKKLEFSKKVFYIIIFIFIIVILYSMALMWRTENTDGLAYLIPSIGTLAATGCGFYFWKAKAENILKINKTMDLERFKETNNIISDVSSSIQDDNVQM